MDLQLLPVATAAVAVPSLLLRYGNTVYQDLWREVANTLGDPGLIEKLKPWTVDEGYPVVKLRWKNGGDDTVAGEMRLLQQRFFRSSASREAAPPGTDDTVWWIPLQFAAQRPGSDPGEWRSTCTPQGFVHHVPCSPSLFRLCRSQ